MRYEEIQTDKITPDQRARMTIEHPAMRELVDDVRVHGIRTPIIVRPAGRGQYAIEDGHRRYEAAIACGLELVPCVVRESTDVSSTEDQARAAMQRAGITAAESARIVAALRAEGRSQDDVARICGRTQSWVSYCEGIARLPREILEHDARVGEIGFARLRQWAIAETHARGAAMEEFARFRDGWTPNAKIKSDPDAKLLAACTAYQRSVPPPAWPVALVPLMEELHPDAKKAPTKAAKKAPTKAAKKAPTKAAKKAPTKAAKKGAR